MPIPNLKELSIERQDLLDAATDVSILIGVVLILTVVLELFSLDTVRNVLKQPDGKSLYIQAWAYNFINHFLIGLPGYPIAVAVLCSPKKTTEEINIWEQIFKITWICLVHAVSYYNIHKLFHQNPTLYKRFHSFHHRFNKYTPPSSGNAVTVGEYVMAYITPLIIACLLPIPIDSSALLKAIYILQVTHLLVHTPKLEDLSEQWIPSVLVSTKNHQEHHRLVNCHYASPTFNIDTILRWTSATEPKKNKTN